MPRVYAFLTAALIGISYLAPPTFAGEDGQSGKGKGKGKGRATPEVMFKHRDTNNDGKLSLEEFTANRKNATKAAAHFKMLDTNNDGFVTLDELKTGFEKIGRRKKA